MIQELVFTSAPRGLQIGKSGFCTVANSESMPVPLVRLLESLSGYRHMYAPGTPDADSNPVVFSHLKAKVGGRTYNVLSRVADAGFDYSNRSNKLAHHFAISKIENLPNGPTAYLRNQALFFESWDREPAKLPQRKVEPSPSVTQACQIWQQETGDAGWAGDVIEAIQKRRQVYLIVDQNTPALDLIHEVLMLLPEHQRWQTTFSTFFTKLPPNVECQIRCVMTGSPEANVARRSPVNLVMDLTSPLGVSTSSHGEAARTGTPIRTTSPVSSRTSVSGIAVSRNRKRDLVTKSVDASEFDAHELPDTPPELITAASAPPSLARSNDSGSRLMLIVFATAGLILAVLLAAFLIPGVRKSLVEGEKQTIAPVVDPQPNVEELEAERKRIEAARAAEKLELARKEKEAQAEKARIEAENKLAEEENKRLANLEKKRAAAKKKRESEARKLKTEMRNRISKNDIRTILFETPPITRQTDVTILAGIDRKNISTKELNLQLVSIDSEAQDFQLKTREVESKWEIGMVPSQGQSDSLPLERFGWLSVNKFGDRHAIEFTNDSEDYALRNRAFELAGKANLVVSCFDGEQTIPLQPPVLVSRKIGLNNQVSIFRDEYEYLNEQLKPGQVEYVRTKIVNSHSAPDDDEAINLDFNLAGFNQASGVQKLIPKRRLTIFNSDQGYEANWSLTDVENASLGQETFDISFERTEFRLRSIRATIEKSIKQKIREYDKDDPNTQPLEELLLRIDKMKGWENSVREQIPDRLEAPIEFKSKTVTVFLFVYFDDEQKWEEAEMRDAVFGKR